LHWQESSVRDMSAEEEKKCNK
jgi:hypothetical protein